MESDAARFRVRRDGGPTGNPTCKLCKSGEEDPVHFLAVCNALQAERQSLLSHAPLNLPDPARDPSAFTEIILGVDWIDDLDAQAFFISSSLILNRKELNYSSTYREHSTFQVYSPIKEATKRQVQVRTDNT